MRNGKELMLKANDRPTLRIQEPAGKAHHLSFECGSMVNVGLGSEPVYNGVEPHDRFAR